MTNQPGSSSLPTWPCILLAAVAMGVPAQNTAAATFTVTSLADSGPGTLRAALANAGNGDTVDATGLSGTILLTGGELLVPRNISIVGPGPGRLAVDGNASSRVFHFGSNTVASLSGMTITNGLVPGANSPAYGGGIYNDHAKLTVVNCTITNNSAVEGGGLCNDARLGSATLTIADSAISGNKALDGGGGLQNYGISGTATLAISHCLISGNKAMSSRGGGISNLAEGGGGFGDGSATTTVISSTINGNSARDRGGGIHNDGSYGSAALAIIKSTITSNSCAFVGGGIENHSFSGTATVGITNSTLSGNFASNTGGAINNESATPLIVVNSTFSGNSAPFGGNNIYNDGGFIAIGNTILNVGPSGVGIDGAGTVISLGYNLDAGGGLPAGATDQVGINPLLGPLQDNGGATFTQALLAGSPAIDMGRDFSTSATDQRGRARPFVFPGASHGTRPPGGDGSDIGAYELAPPPLAIGLSDVITLSWPAADTGYVLQYNTNANSPSGWAPLPGSPVVSGNLQVQTDSPLVPGPRFYRLKQ